MQQTLLFPAQQRIMYIRAVPFMKVLVLSRTATTHLATHEIGSIGKYGLIASLGCSRQQRAPVPSPSLENVNNLNGIALK